MKPSQPLSNISVACPSMLYPLDKRTFISGFISFHVRHDYVKKHYIDFIFVFFIYLHCLSATFSLKHCISQGFKQLNAYI